KPRTSRPPGSHSRIRETLSRPLLSSPAGSLLKKAIVVDAPVATIGNENCCQFRVRAGVLFVNEPAEAPLTVTSMVLVVPYPGPTLPTQKERRYVVPGVVWTVC